MAYFDEIVGKEFFDGEQALFDDLEKRAQNGTAKQAEFLRGLTNLEKFQFENLVWSWSARITQYGVECANVMAEAERWAAAQIELQRKHGIGVEFRRELNELINKLKAKGNNDKQTVCNDVEEGATEGREKSTTGSESTRSNNQISDTSQMVRDTNQLIESNARRATNQVLHSAKWQKFGL